MPQLIDQALIQHRAVSRALASVVPEWYQLDISMSQLKVLFLLHGNPSPMTMGQLASAAGIALPSASLLVDRLVHAGLVARHHDAADRRRVLVSLTARGEELATRLREGRAAHLREWLSELPAADLKALVRGLNALAAIAQSSTAGEQEVPA